MNKMEKQLFLARLEDDIEVNIAYDAVLRYREQFEGSEATEFDLAPPTIKVDENIALYKNSDSPYFWCRLKIDGLKGYVKKSTKKKAIAEASAEAKSIRFIVTEQVKAGTYFEKEVITWRKVCVQTVNALEKQAEKDKKEGNKKSGSARYASIIKMYYKTIDDWRDLDIKSFGYADLIQLKELDNFKDMPKSSATKRKTALKEIFEFALVNKYIDKKPDLPTFDYISTEEGKPFSLDDREVIMSNFINFLESGRPNYITKHKRTILPLYVNFLILTGVRPGEEAMNIRWENIQKEKKKDENGEIKFYYSLEITNGKRSKRVKRNKKIIQTSRTIIIKNETILTLERLYYVMNGIKKGIDEIIEEKGSDLVFQSNTDADLEMASTFKQYVEYLGSKIKNYYTLYNCRHEHINMCMEQGLDAAIIATQCGTSIATIDNHYKKVRQEEIAFKVLSPEEIEQINPA